MATQYTIAMPELPEVETVRLGIAPVLEGRTITRAQTRRGDLRRPFPRDFAARLTGRKVLALRRRAKYILADLDGGETLVIHLGMSGRMSVQAEGRAARKIGNYVHDIAEGLSKHDHVVLETDAPARILFNDHRRFGLMDLVPTGSLEEDRLFRDIGIEPLTPGFNAKHLAAAIKGKKTPIKSALLDQRVVAGLGNIYVSEALFRSHISPRRLAGSLKPGEIGRLVPAVKKVLQDAIKAGGSSLRDHARPDGELGEFQHHFLVYDREGKPCKNRCPGTVKRIVQAGRSTFYCPRCQK
jgi:formamidopyrimidine-DNA glycosylase